MSVYFIEGVGTGRVKIGFAKDPEQRRKAFQPCSPVELKLLATGTCRSDRYVERVLHERFAAHRLHGEWFTLTPQLARLIARIAETGAVPERLDIRRTPMRYFGVDFRKCRHPKDRLTERTESHTKIVCDDCGGFAWVPNQELLLKELRNKHAERAVAA